LGIGHEANHTIKSKLFRNQISFGIEKNGGRLFRGSKLALSCRAEGKEGGILKLNLLVKKFPGSYETWKFIPLSARV
jgi:hypothetical protein